MPTKKRNGRPSDYETGIAGTIVRLAALAAIIIIAFLHSQNKIEGYWFLQIFLAAIALGIKRDLLWQDILKPIIKSALSAILERLLGKLK